MLLLTLDLTYNLALLVALSVISGFLRQHRSNQAWGPVLQGLLFGGAAVIGMMHPLVLGPGLIFDGRSVMISLCGLFFGPLAVGIAGGLAALYRISLGGAGVHMGWLVITASALLGLAFHRRWTLAGTNLSAGRLLGFGLAVHVAMVLLMFTLPAGVGLGVIKRLGLPILLAYPLATLLIGKVLSAQAAGIRTVEALRESEALLSAITEAVPDPIFLKGREGQYIYSNSAMHQVIGKTREQVLGKTDAEVYDDPAVAAALMETDQRIMASNQGEVVEELVPGPKGYRTYLSNKVPYRDAEGRVTGLIGSARDITDRKSAEAALRDSEARLRRAESVAHFGNWELILAERKIRGSMGAKALYGLQSNEWSLAEVQALPLPEYRPMLDAALAALIEHNHPYSVKFRIKRPNDGQMRDIHSIAEYDPNKGAIFGVVNDITERKQAAEEKAKLQAQLQQSQKMESLGNLAGGVAHDMNNVLGAILGLASANIEAQPPGSPAYRAFDTISQAAVRGGKMVKSLLSFARQSPLEAHVLDLNAILLEEVNLLERTTLAKVQLEMDLASELRPILGDPSALTHAFMNLCVNAVDAMPANGTLTLRTRNVDNDWIEVLVEDTGTGMPRSVLEKAMDPFFTTKEVGKGTGLGLSMVYSTVTAHRGQIKILSEPGQGTRVVMRFPACEVLAQSPPSLAEPRPESSPQALKVLVVDDDELIQSSMQTILEMLGHRAVSVSCGEDALAQLEAGFQPNVVILDMNMPGLGGAGTLPRLRTLNATVPVLLATGRVDQFASDLAGAYPHVTLLSKPYTMKELQQHLDSIGRG